LEGKIKVLKKELIKFIVFFNIFILCACSPHIIVYENTDQGEVFISEASLYDAVPPFQHPVKIPKDTIVKMMRQMKCDSYDIFTEPEIKNFAGEISAGLKKARKNSFVSFYISEQMLRYISGGEIYVKDSNVIWFFYPASELYQRSPVVSDRVKCLSNKKYIFTPTGEPVIP